MHKFDAKQVAKLDNPERRRSMPPDQILEKFGLQDKGTFLDIGCGIGYFSGAAAERLKHGKVIGIDISEVLLDLARERGAHLENLIYDLCTEYTFPVASHSVDYAFACNVIHEIEDKEKYFQEIKRVLKPGGYLYVIDWEKREMAHGPAVEERFSAEAVKAVAHGMGMVFVADIPVHDDHYGIKFRML